MALGKKLLLSLEVCKCHWQTCSTCKRAANETVGGQCVLAAVTYSNASEYAKTNLTGAVGDMMILHLSRFQTLA